MVDFPNEDVGLNSLPFLDLLAILKRTKYPVELEIEALPPLYFSIYSIIEEHAWNDRNDYVGALSDHRPNW
jgi:sulfite reductase alpha subunit-like flavoprotein